MPVSTNSRDRLLANVTSLIEAYGLCQTSGFLGQVCLIDIYSVLRDSSLNSHGLIGRKARGRRSGRDNRFPRGGRGRWLSNQIKSLDTQSRSRSDGKPHIAPRNLTHR